MPELVYLIVYGSVLFYVCVRGRNIGLGLVVIVIADKILHRIIGEKFPKLIAQLGGQGFVMGDNQCGALYPLYNIGHGKGLARTGNTQQRLVFVVLIKPVNQFIYGRRLVTGGLKFRVYLKLFHIISPQLSWYIIIAHFQNN